MCDKGAVEFFVCLEVTFFPLAYLVIDMESRYILPLILLDTDLDCRKSRALDAAVSFPYHSDGDPTPDIPACMIVWLPPLGGKVEVQALQRGLRLNYQQAVN